MLAMSRFQIPATSSPEMEPEIWRRLPEELLERILARLPLETFLNLRSTCKRFHSLLFSPSFLSQTKTQFLPPLLLLSHPQFHNNFPIYDSSLSRWRTLTLPLPQPCGPHLISTSNGLLCFSLQHSFLICNLLTKSIKTIDFPTYPFVLATLISPPSSTSYKIFLLSSSSSSSNSAFVYDSRIRNWARFKGHDPILSESSHQEGVFFNGSLYFTTREPFSVMGFDLEIGKWERMNVNLPEELAFARLVSDYKKKRVFLVGGIGRNGISRNVKVWELGEGARNWVELVSLPELICRKFVSICYHNYEHVYCFWHDGLICVCCYTWPEILLYKVGRRTWHWLPKCPLLPDKWSCGFRWFSFVPDLFALA
ncbi:galactose oxidase/kelch repeat superfamily protein [Tasmannia lanceolata]|uniref:galactose oxidase/kelch repeat superfamily protein n=1 Tax=Tasmannia lanceolata TaxID=3420 RepID=UPI0040647CCC